jgi:hypothetical protein
MKNNLYQSGIGGRTNLELYHNVLVVYQQGTAKLGAGYNIEFFIDF